jgi:CRISPR/Cas system-associated protein endoribonuclease Cas2
MLPPEGQVRIFMMTDKQYGRMLVFNGKNSSPGKMLSINSLKLLASIMITFPSYP